MTESNKLRARLWQLLGDIPQVTIPNVRVMSRSDEIDHIRERFTFENGVGDSVYGYLLMPKGIDTPAPAVLYHHEHGGKYPLGKDAAIRVRENGYAPGLALVAAGFIVMAIDAYGFGERERKGPAGEAESGAVTEMSLFKHFLWQGKTLWGMMIHDDLCALAYLRSRPEVNESRIGATGMSLGASRSTWVAALDETIKAVAPISQMTRYRDFADNGHYRLHSIYYFVPGVLASGIDMEHIVALTAPRYQLILTGDSDPLSPIAGIHKIVDYARNVYAEQGAADQFEVKLYQGVAHAYLPAMVESMRAAFIKHL